MPQEFQVVPPWELEAQESQGTLESFLCCLLRVKAPLPRHEDGATLFGGPEIISSVVEPSTRTARFSLLVHTT